MKLIIDIPKDDYNNIEPFLNGETIKGGFNLFKVLEMIKNGIPLDDLRAEIEHLTITEGGEDYTRKMAELYSLKIKILQIIDKYKAEVESQESEG